MQYLHGPFFDLFFKLQLALHNNHTAGEDIVKDLQKKKN